MLEAKDCCGWMAAAVFVCGDFGYFFRQALLGARAARPHLLGKMYNQITLFITVSSYSGLPRVS